MKKHYDVAAYIWPAYTGDETRTRMFWKEGYGEWQSVHNVKENSTGKPADYHWDRRPLWGYVNEANPDVMEMEINCAHRHGVNVFIYDWYWYDDRPFLENCLRDGYLKARNNDLVKFYIMWANHNVYHTWNIELSSVPELEKDLIWTGSVGFDVFKNLVRRWIDEYFVHPSYYKIEGKPVFMLYDIQRFILGLGGPEGARQAIDYFRAETEKAGFPGLHLQIVMNSTDQLDYHGQWGGEAGDLYAMLGFDSAVHYQMKAITDMNRDYSEVIKATKEEYDRMDTLEGVTYFPHVSLGWDNNPRFRTFQPCVTTGNTPEKIEIAMRQAKDYVDSHDLPAPLVIVNSWNEWTETSYLQPDNLYGYGYLEAVKRVFVEEE